MSVRVAFRSLLWVLVGAIAAVVIQGAAVASADGVAWKISLVAQPTNLMLTGGSSIEPLDQYVLVLTNTGSVASSSSEPIMLTDKLPAGVALGESAEGPGWECPASRGSTVINCTFHGVVSPLNQSRVLIIPVVVAHAGPLIDSVVVSGGGAPVATAEVSTVAGADLPAFGFLEFSLQASRASGAPDTQAGDHPYGLTTTLGFPQGEIEAIGAAPHLVQAPRDLEVELPAGLVGDPQAAPQCTIVAVFAETCHPSSRVGTLFVDFAQAPLYSEETSSGYPIYNVVPERGYPAEFGVFIEGINRPALLYGSVGPAPEYRLRVSSPDIPVSGAITSAIVTFFGDPQGMDGGANSSIPFLTNSSHCSGAPLVTNVQTHTWEEQTALVEPSFPVESAPVSGCDLLRFEPSISLAPETKVADEPSGYTVEARFPQGPQGLGSLATPPVKNTTVTFPLGLTLNPSAADGLAACPAEGPEGINITGPLSEERGPDGGLQPAAGHCPLASQVGTVEAVTPLLSEPLQGHVYVAAPGCGGAGQGPCTEVDAADGNLFGVYLQLEGSGVVIKLHGTVSANPATGQLTASFRETPQQPVSDLKIVLEGGPRAPLANPRSCGEAVTRADMTPWSSPETPDAHPTSEFFVSGCEGSLFAPSFLAGTTDTEAGAYTNFSVTFGRSARMQDLGAIQVQTPPGLLGVLSSVALCGEPQAAQGTCSSASEIGTATAGVGSGSHPFWVSGKVYLTGPYNGAPFGLSIVLPAVAGPFNLGTVVERAAVSVDPTTAALTVTSGPIRQILDGIPLRVQTVNVSINKQQFMFNPTNCNAQQITATVASAQGSTAQVASPFAVGGCKNLPFDPGLGFSTRVPASKSDGAELVVKFTAKQGEAHTHSISVSFPKQLPAKLKTIQKACLDTTFDTNPAACPPQSLIGVAKAVTPALPAALVGPVYLVSHGGAAFPDVYFVLQGEGVRINFVGSINISKQGITSATFKNAPDAPISSFEARFPEGQYSALADVGNLCAKTLTMPTTLVGQNGRQLVRSTKLTVAGCPKVKKEKKPATKKRHAKAHGAGAAGLARATKGSR